MYSIVAKAKYEYQEMKLSTLRERIIRENNLSIFDIIRGFHDKTVVNPKYELSFDSKTLAAIRDMQTYYKELREVKVPEKLQALYNEMLEREVPKMRELLIENGIAPKHTLEELVATNNRSYYGDSVFRNKFIAFMRLIDSSFGYSVDTEIKTYIKDELTTYLTNRYGEDYFVIGSLDEKGSQFPWEVNLNNCDNIDYSSIYRDALTKETGIDTFCGYSGYSSADIIGFLDKPLHLGFSMPSVYIHLDEAVAKDVFEKAIEKTALATLEENSVLHYAQNLEAQPITINVNTKTNKYELIDGYKRVLFTTNEELLDMYAPVRVFTDLDDNGFLALLYAANLWKKTYNQKASKISFHDRGYLFALKTRFGFEIPKCFYDKAKAFDLGRKDLTIMEIYDFGATKSYSFNTDLNLGTDKINKCIPEDVKVVGFYDGLASKSHLMSDLQFFYNDYLDIIEKEYGYDANIKNMLTTYIVLTVGRIRRLSNEPTQKNITKDMIESIFSDKDYVKVFAKKHLSSDTYVSKFLLEKGYFESISNRLYQALA